MAIRAFLAISLPDDVRHAVGELSRHLRRAHGRASWVRPENLHVTLRFLGEVSEDQVDALGDFLEAEYRGAGRASIQPTGTGFFPNDQRPSVLWVGVDDLDCVFPALHRIAEAGAKHIGIAPERSAFHPHITLARLKVPKMATKLVQMAHGEDDFQTDAFTPRSVTLLGSTLTRRGAIYDVLREFPLT